MGDRTKIEWCDATWNPVMGCTPVSEGCANCYARTMMRRYAGRKGWPPAPDRVTFFPDRLDLPLRWRRPRRVFVCSMGDLFHEDVPFEFIAQVFDTMAAWRWPNAAAKREGDETMLENPGHTYIVLTKRPQRMRAWLDWVDEHWPSDSPFGIFRPRDWPSHIWLGVTAENQQRANERIPVLLSIPAQVRFVSCEPLLGPIDLTRAEYGPNRGAMNCFGFTDGFGYEAGLQWVVVGGETGPHARPMHPKWVSDLRDQCQAAEVPLFFKGWGEWVPIGYQEREQVGWYRHSDGMTMMRVARRERRQSIGGREYREWPKEAE